MAALLQLAYLFACLFGWPGQLAGCKSRFACKQRKGISKRRQSESAAFIWRRRVLAAPMPWSVVLDLALA